MKFEYFFLQMDKTNDLGFIFYMLKIFHEKLENPVFRYVSTLLWLLCQEEAVTRVSFLKIGTVLGF